MVGNPSAPPFRFLCDEMLGRLARYLRAAGYDSLLARAGIADREWLALARRETRRFLTCDRRVAEHRAARDVAVILPPGDLPTTALYLKAHCGVDWHYATFSRCLLDNSPLRELPDTLAVRLPADVWTKDARWCPDCGRPYWAGSHFRRMQARLELWAAAG